MLRTTRYIVALGLAALMASVWLFSETAVYSIPSNGHGFYGKVTDSSNSLIGAGASIEARINNIHFAQSIDSATDTSTQTTVTHAASDGLNFGVLKNFQVCGDDTQTTGKEGGTKADSITFYVGGVLATIIEIEDAVASRSTFTFSSMASTKLHLRIPSLDATKATAATASTVACSEQAVATPTATPIPTPTSAPAVVAAPAPTSTPAAGAAAAAPLPSPTPSPSPTPTPVTTEQLQTLTVTEQLDTLDLLTTEQQVTLIDDLVEADVDASAILIQGLVTKNVDDAAEILSALGSDVVAAIFANEKLDADAAASVLGSGNMSSDKAAAILTSETLGADRAASILSSDEISIGKAAQILNSANIDADKGAQILNSVNMGADKGAAILNSANTDADKGAAILNSANIDADKGAQILNSANMDADKGAAILNSANMDAKKSAGLLGSAQLSAGKAADILNSNQIDATKAAAILDQPDLTAARSAAILGEVEKTKAGAILEAVSSTKVEGIVANMPEAKLVERLPEMSAGKLHSLSPGVLFDNLPSVPTEAIAREFAPVVDPSCAPPESTQESAERVVYTVCDTVESAWAKLVGSPAPIDSILGKFTTVRSGIRVGIEEIESLPAAAPQFSADRFLNSFFNINIEGAEEGDLSAIHTTMFVEKSWIQANGIHKWSISFNRLDEELGAWVPVTAKRVRETTDRIYYTGVLPGFSTFAITGGTAPVTPQFTVREPTDRPFIQRAGPQTTVAAEITNDGSELLHYVANLWINDTIDRTMLIRVESGETKQFEFPAFTLDPGEYDVRVERLLGSYKILAPTPILTPAPVTAPPTPTLTPAPPTPIALPAPATPTALPAPATPTALPAPTLTPPPLTPTLTPVAATPTALPVPTLTPALTPPPPIPTFTPAPTLTPPPPIEEEGEEEEEGGISLLLIIIIGIIVITASIGAVYFYLRRQGKLPPRMPGAPGSSRETGLGPPIDAFGPEDRP